MAMNDKMGGGLMDIRKKDHVPSEFTPVERYAEIRRCMWILQASNGRFMVN